MKLGSLEELVLLAVIRLFPRASLVPIVNLLGEAGYPTTVGTVSKSLKSLEYKSCVNSLKGHVQPKRGGRRVIYYIPLQKGVEALSLLQLTRDHLGHDIQRLEIVSIPKADDPTLYRQIIEAGRKWNDPG